MGTRSGHKVGNTNYPSENSINTQKRGNHQSKMHQTLDGNLCIIP